MDPRTGGAVLRGPSDHGGDRVQRGVLPHGVCLPHLQGGVCGGRRDGHGRRLPDPALPHPRLQVGGGCAAAREGGLPPDLRTGGQVAGGGRGRAPPLGDERSGREVPVGAARARRGPHPRGRQGGGCELPDDGQHGDLALGRLRAQGDGTPLSPVPRHDPRDEAGRAAGEDRGTLCGERRVARPLPPHPGLRRASSGLRRRRGPEQVGVDGQRQAGYPDRAGRLRGGGEEAERRRGAHLQVAQRVLG
mmetsp:Transcript_17794/g.43003  ORF Transcript_17794/g.43003 Transcript_17794/m.43003 type:complete len:247 (-) Transcript_17794:985-1725(-)